MTQRKILKAIRRSDRILKPNVTLRDYAEDKDELMQAVDQDIAAYEEYKSSQPKQSGSKHFNRSVESDVVVVVKTVLGKRKEPESSPAKPLREKVRKHPRYFTPEKTEVIEHTQNGSPAARQSKTPRKRIFVPTFKAFIVLPKTNASDEDQKIACEFYQTRDSALQRKKDPNVFEEDLQKVRNQIKPPADSVYKIERDPITAGRLDEAADSKRLISEEHKGMKASAVSSEEAGLNVACEHSHMEARQHGQQSAIGESGRDRYRTFPARREHNSMRLVTTEIPKIQECIRLLGVLFYSNTVRLLQDENGKPIPLIKCEEVIWEDEYGRQLWFVYDALKGFTPAEHYEDFCGMLAEDTFASIQTVSENDFPVLR